MTKLLDPIKKAIKPIYFWARRVINRVPLQLIKGLQSLPLGITVAEPESLSPPTHSCYVEDWFQGQEQKDFSHTPRLIRIDDACEFKRETQPKTGDPTPHPQFGKESIAKPFPASVSMLPQGRVWGDYGAIITADNVLLEDVSVYRQKKNWGEHRIYSDWHLCPLQKIEGTAAVLATDSAGIYYHWMMDLLLRYALLLRSGFTLASFDKLILGECSKPFQIETLELLGINLKDTERIIKTSEHPHIQATTLVVPSYPAAAAQYRSWHVQFLRETFLPKTPSVEATRPVRRIYVSRGDATYRRVLNEDQVIELLLECDFEIVQLANLSFLEQVMLMQSADAIVAPHGSGLTNLIFCAPGTKVVEIFSPEMVALYFWKLADLCQIDYHYTVGDRCKGEEYDQSWNRIADILVSIERLKDTLRIAELM